MCGIGAFQAHNRAQGLCVVAKSACALHRLGQSLLARMAKRRMAQSMRQTHRLCKVFIHAQSACKNPPDLRHFKTMREPGAIMIAFRSDKDLSFRFQPAKTHRMNNAITVALEIGAWASHFQRSECAAEFSAAMRVWVCSKGSALYHPASLGSGGLRLNRNRP